MKRRTLLSGVAATVTATAVAGCSTDSSGGSTTTGDAGEQETLASTTASAATTTAASDDEPDNDGTTAEEAATATTSSAPDVAFRALVEDIAKCSKTCRTLTYTVQNRGSDAAPDVAVRIRVYTGGNKIWDKTQDVGTVDARSQRTGITRDIDVGIFDGRKIQNNDGEVTIELTPQAAGVSETFTFERTLDV